jgi:PilZ domain/Family of unknown function (DUF5683)
MSNNSTYYSHFSRHAARLSLVFPGLGQLHNKQYFKGMLVVSIFSFSVVLLLLLLSNSANRHGSPFIPVLAVLPLIVWGVSIYDAYHVALDQRQRDAKRYNVQIITKIRGSDENHRGFEEVTMTKNVSRLGACLILSRELIRGSQVSLEFEGNEKVRARVVWTRETGNAQEHLVGMELLSPLKQFE